MIGVLIRLQALTIKGRVVRALRLLRQPKYLVGFIVGAGWMATWVLRPAMRGGAPVNVEQWAVTGSAFRAIFHDAAALMLTAVTPLGWILPWGQLGLPFREAELTMLLQAPLTRRQVMQYGLLKSELGVVISAFFVSVFVAGRGTLGRLPSFAATWVLFELLHLLSKSRALFLLRQAQLPPAAARARRLVVSAVVLAFYAVLLTGAVQLAGTLRTTVLAGDAKQTIANLAAIEAPPLLAALVAPAWWLIAPVFASSWAGFFLPLAGGALMLVAARELVLRSKARFEESSLTQAQQDETKKTPGRRFAVKSGRARERQPFPLRPQGRPELALIWKNAVQVSRMSWRTLALVAGGALVAIAATLALFRLNPVFYFIPATIGLFFMIFVPFVTGMMWNNDMRSDVRYLELVRTWPLSPRRYVVAQIASPALLSVVAAALGAGLLAACSFGAGWQHVVSGHSTGLQLLPRSGSLLGVPNAIALPLLLVSFLLIAGPLSFLSSALQNLAILFAPAWIPSGPDRSQGIAMFGQRVVTSALLALSLILAAIPSGLLLGAAALVQTYFDLPWTAWEFPFLAALAAIPIAAIDVLLVNAAALLWDRLDPSEEMLEAGR